jgi:hypothetical protein
MAVDRLGNTIAAGQVLLLAGRVLYIDGDQISLIVGNNNSLTVKVKAGDVVQVDAATAGGGGGVTDHGALTGLADDDHTQYAFRGAVTSSSLTMATNRILARITGGTGAIEELTDTQVRTLLGLGAIALLASVSLTANVTGTLPIANGGTGATSASAARTALDVARSVHGHAAADITIDDSEFTGAFAGQGITDVQSLAAWLDANLGA